MKFSTINTIFKNTTKNHLFCSLALSIVMLAPMQFAVADDVSNAVETEKTEMLALNDRLKKAFGSAPSSIKPSRLENLYEVMYGTEVVYFSKDGTYFLAGDMIELDSRKNISEMAKQSVRKDIMSKQDNKPVVFKAKDEKHVLTVFTDIDCGYCAKLHREMPELNEKGITVEYLMYPRAGIGSKSYEKAVSMWCADDQQQMMTDAKERREIPAKTCDNPITEQFQLGRKVGVSGTPALVTSSGKLLPGYMPADRLLSVLKKDAESTKDASLN